MPKYNGDMQAAVDDNSMKPCKARGCTKNRYRISGYCTSHTTKNNLNGHPTSTPFRAYKHFPDLYQIALDIVTENRETHEGIRYGLATINRYLDAAEAGSPMLSIRLSKSLQAAISRGTTAEEMLAVAGAVLAFSHTIQGSELQKNDRYMLTTIGMNMLKVRKTVARLQGKEKKELGTLLWKDLAGGLLFRLEESIVKRMQLEEKALDCQRMEIP